MNKKTASISRAILIGFIILYTLLVYGASMGIYSETVINPWLPLGLSAVIALISVKPMEKIWRNVTHSDTRWFNTLCHLVVATGTIMAGFYILNYAFADKSSIRKEAAVVERRYSETRYQSKRISRRVYGRGTPYKVYFIDVRFTTSGKSKSISLKRNLFNRYHTGDTLYINTENGLLGYPVIIRDTTPIDVPPSTHIIR